jgi:threonine dehydrogenase-like Zn-dependent dehydrogenase
MALEQLVGTRAAAVVQTGPGAFTIQSFDVPGIGDDDAVVAVEACGICGTDAETFTGGTPMRYPVIPGHEPVGRIAAIGDRAAARWRVGVGDRVVLQSDFGCGRCVGCMRGDLCVVDPGSLGFQPTSRAPSLWGGYAEALYLAPGAMPHRIADHVPLRAAALYNALGAGFAWAVEAPGLRYGETVAVMGPGQRGLASVVAARAAGASFVAVTGLGSRDAHKLALAADLGADVVIDVEQDDPVERVLAATGGDGVDVVVDTTPHATGPVLDALRVARPGGTVVLGGLKGRGNDVSGFPVDDVAMRRLRIVGVRAVDFRSFRNAVRLLERSPGIVERMHTHHFSLDAAAAAVRSLTDPSAGAISITIEPGL